MNIDPRSPAARSRLPFVLVAVVVATHCYALAAFGPVFWVDSFAYVNLAESMRSGTLDAFYSDIGGWVYSHLQPGLPMVWLGASYLTAPEDRWFAVALFQHAVAAASLCCFALTVHRYWPTRLNLAAVAALCLLPFYQAMHNAILTESLSSSLLLLALALTIRLMREPRWLGGTFAGLLACLLVATQLRSYLGVFVGSLAAIALVAHRALTIGRGLALAITGCVAIAAFPTYRYAITGAAFLPSGGINAPMAALWLNVNPGEQTERALASAGLPPDIAPQRLMREGLDFPDALSIARHWKSLGLDVAAANRRATGLGSVIGSESADVIGNRLLAGLASSGSIAAFALVRRDRMVFRDYDARAMYKHQMSNYRYLSWQRQDLRETPRRLALFDQFFRTPHAWDDFAAQRTARQALDAAMRPKVEADRTLPSDPLRLSAIPPDLWFLLALVAIAYLVRAGEFALAGIAALLIAANFLVSFSFPLGNTRYAYPLVPIYFMLPAVAVVASRRRRGATPASATDAGVA